MRGHIAILQVEVEEKHSAALPIGQVPCQVYREGCCADAASGADGSNHLSQLPDYRLSLGRAGRRRQRLCQSWAVTGFTIYSLTPAWTRSR